MMKHTETKLHYPIQDKTQILHIHTNQTALFFSEMKIHNNTASCHVVNSNYCEHKLYGHQTNTKS